MDLVLANLSRGMQTSERIVIWFVLHMYVTLQTGFVPYLHLKLKYIYASSCSWSSVGLNPWLQPNKTFEFKEGFLELNQTSPGISGTTGSTQSGSDRFLGKDHPCINERDLRNDGPYIDQQWKINMVDAIAHEKAHWLRSLMPYFDYS